MDTFDFIIAGAGSAGCVLANRLSADPGNRVCLIEAGPRDTSPLIHVPLGMLPLMKHKVLNWRFNSIPQEGTAKRPIYVPRGKTLGGSSSINGMVYMRGNRRDYDDWAAAGNPGWSYREVMPYFLRSEHNEVHGSPWHGTDGPMNVTDLDSYSPLAGMMCDAAQALQWQRNADFNGPEQEGFGIRQATMRGGRRESASTAFLRPALHRPNLTVVTGCVVDKLNFDGRRATAVEVVDSAGAGGRRRIAARREIVLAGGSIASPMILMRSGIGDGEELRRFGIAAHHHLPGVGRNLQDHLITNISHTSDSTIPYGLSAKTLPWAAWQLVKYALFRKGMLANNVVHACGFVRTTADADRPDIQLILMPANRTPENPGAFGHGYGIIVLLLRPKSHGRVSLTGADPHAAPMIDPRFLSQEEDVACMLRGMKLARSLLAQPAWDRVRGPEALPGPSVRDDAALTDYLRRSCGTAFHPVGTCKMGTGDGAVVDAQLRVHGMEALRVVDASVMPDIVCGNTNAPTIMIAEKAADMILGGPPLPAIAESVLQPAAAKKLNPDKISEAAPLHEPA